MEIHIGCIVPKICNDPGHSPENQVDLLAGISANSLFQLSCLSCKASIEGINLMRRC